MTTWDRIELIRSKNRPTIRDYIPLLFDGFVELHGDRLYGDDPAILGGIARYRGTPVTVIGQVKGRNLEENKRANFAMPHPEGYRKALRLMRQAEKFRRPVILFIDTPGAFCDMESEERGQGEAIARCLYEMMTLKTPILSIVLGEGGSGGALALGENAVYSVISPRGCASILWKDPSREKEAAEMLRITAQDLLELGIAETIIPEPETHADPAGMARAIDDYLSQTISNYLKIPIDKLLQNRYDKFRKIGQFLE